MSLTIDWHGTHEQLWNLLEAECPDIKGIIAGLYLTLGEHYPKRETRDYEAALLYVLAQRLNRPGARIFEIGTCWGWTAAVMQSAAPQAKVYTCTPNPVHVQIARRNLFKRYPGIEVLDGRSVDFLNDFPDIQADDPDGFDMIFVDGDHQRVSEDFSWYNKVRIGGLMIFHDYCPAAPECTGPRPCRWVYDSVNQFAEQLHAPDVLMVDDHKEGVAGFYRQAGEDWE